MDDKPLPKPDGFPNWATLFPSQEKLKEAFRSGLASQSNRELLAMFEPICAKFHSALMATVEARDTSHLHGLGLLAALYVDKLDVWIDAVTPHSPDANLMILRDYWSETVDDITATLKRVREQEEKGVEGDDDDPSEAWKNL